MSNYIDTRDLIEERNNLKEQILESFQETLERYPNNFLQFYDVNTLETLSY